MSNRVLTLHASRLRPPGGSIPQSLCHLPALTEFQAHNNKLNGTLPYPCNWTNIQTVKLSNNLLTGPLPNDLPNFGNIEKIYLADNRLTSTIPDSFATFQKLTLLDLSRNRIKDTFAHAFSTLGKSSSLVQVRLTSNKIYGPMHDTDFYNSQTLIAYFPNLLGLWLNNNQITGTISSFFQFIYFLGQLDLSQNKLTGEIPSNAFPSISTFNVTGNPGLRADKLPSFLRQRQQQVPLLQGMTGYKKDLSCPSIAGSSTPVIAFVDPTYYTFKGCECAEGSYWSSDDGQCRALQPHIHRQGPTQDQQFFPEPGYYPLENQSNTFALQRVTKCYNPDACTVNGTVFQCAEGYQSTLCSQCMDHYYPQSFVCTECQPYQRWLKPLLGAVYVPAFTYYCWHRRTNKSGMMVILLFYLQLLGELRKSAAGSLLNDIPADIFHYVDEGGSAGISLGGLACTFPSWDQAANLVTIAGLLWCMVLTAFALGFHRLWTRSRPRKEPRRTSTVELPTSMSTVSTMEAQLLPTEETTTAVEVEEKLSTRAVRLLLLLVYAIHFNALVESIKLVNCSLSDAGDSYLVFYPYKECTAWRTTVGIIGILVYGVALPGVLSAIILWHRHTLNPWMEPLVSFLTGPYRNGIWWWEGVQLWRKVFIAAVLAGFEFRSVISPTILSIALVILLLVQVYLRPFQMRVENNMETLSLLAAFGTYQAGILTQEGSGDLEASNGARESIMWMVVMGNLVVVGAFVVLLASDPLHRLAACLRLSSNNAMERMVRLRSGSELHRHDLEHKNRLLKALKEALEMERDDLNATVREKELQLRQSETAVARCEKEKGDLVARYEEQVAQLQAQLNARK